MRCAAISDDNYFDTPARVVDARYRELAAALARFGQPAYRKRCAAALALRDSRRMNRGLTKLRVL